MAASWVKPVRTTLCVCSNRLTRTQAPDHDLLALSRITTGGEPFEAVNLNQTVEEV